MTSPTQKQPAYYNAGEDLARYREHSMQPTVEKLCLQHLLPTPGWVLDVGCASGRTSAFLRDRGWHVTGIELDPVGAAQARLLLNGVHEANAEHTTAFPTGTFFDLILMTDILEHMIDPWAALARYKKLLKKPGGQLLVVLPNACHIAVIAHLLDGGFPYKEQGIMDSGHLRWFTPDTAMRMIKDAGLTVVDTVFRGDEDQEAVQAGRVRLNSGVTLDLTAIPVEVRLRHSVRKMHFWCEATT